MPAYRLYYLDGAGKVSSAEWIEADSDEAAVDVARSDKAAAKSEVWQGERLVARIAKPRA